MTSKALSPHILLMLALTLPPSCTVVEDTGPALGTFRQEPCSERPPIAVVDPAVIDFGAVRIGEESRAELTISNAGGGVLVVEQALFQGSPEFSFVQVGSPGAQSRGPASPGSTSSGPASPGAAGLPGFIDWAPPLLLGSGKSAKLQVRYAPVANLGVTGRLVLRTNGGGPATNPEVLVAGEGVPFCPVADPLAIELSQRPVGEAAIARVELVGCENGHRVFELALTGDSHPDYALDLLPLLGPDQPPPGPEAPVSVQPGARLSFHVVFLPSSVSTTPSLATVRIVSSAAPEPIYVELSGAGKPIL